MGIWKNAGGGYRSGGDEYDEYLFRMRNSLAPRKTREEYEEHIEGYGRDVQLVRKAGVAEVRDFLDLMDPYHTLNNHQIELVLKALDELTPDGKDKSAWKILHGRG